MKRIFDLVISIPAVILISPVMMAIGALTLLDSGRPIMFTQVRVGRNGREFRILKFRTMVQGSSGPFVTASGDRRVTRLGRWLRASKTDEIPQLLNVIRGEMSLVGPRPEVAQYVQRWPDDVRKRVLSVRPGITDPASILFRHEERLLAAAADPDRYYLEELTPKKLALYEDYVATRSLQGDLVIIARTIAEVFRRG